MDWRDNLRTRLSGPLCSVRTNETLCSLHLFNTANTVCVEIENGVIEVGTAPLLTSEGHLTFTFTVSSRWDPFSAVSGPFKRQSLWSCLLVGASILEDRGLITKDHRDAFRDAVHKVSESSELK